MELEAMARPMTERQWGTFQAVNRLADRAFGFLEAGDVGAAAKCYHEAAQLPHLTDSCRVSLLLTSAELYLELLRELRGLGRPTLH